MSKAEAFQAPPNRSVPDNRGLGIDWVGIALVGLALFAVLVPLIEAPGIGWQLWMWPFVIAVPFLATGFTCTPALIEILCFVSRYIFQRLNSIAIDEFPISGAYPSDITSLSV